MSLPVLHPASIDKIMRAVVNARTITGELIDLRIGDILTPEFLDQVPDHVFPGETVH